MSTLYDYRTSLGFLTATSNRLMGLTAMRNFSEAGVSLTIEQWALLIQLWDKDGMTQEELAFQLCLEKSSLSRTLGTLERRGLIRRERDQRDARCKRLYTTSKADAMRQIAVEAVIQTQNCMLKGLSQEEVSVTINTLERVKQNLQEKLK